MKRIIAVWLVVLTLMSGVAEAAAGANSESNENKNPSEKENIENINDPVVEQKVFYDRHLSEEQEAVDRNRYPQETQSNGVSKNNNYELRLNRTLGFGTIYSLHFSYDKLAAGVENNILIINISNLNIERRIFSLSDYVCCVAWQPQGHLLATGHSDGIINLWNASTYVNVVSIRAHSNCVSSISWCPNGTRLASCSNDNTIKIWDATTWNNIQKLTPHGNDSINCIVWSPNGAQLASASSDSSIKIWNTSNWENKKILTEHTASVTSISWSLDGTKLASGSNDCTIKIWDVETWGCTKTITANWPVFIVAWSPDYSRLASGISSSVDIWNTSNWKKIESLFPHGNLARAVSWSLDGKKFASGGGPFDHAIKIWNVSTWEKNEIIGGHTDAVTTVSWSPDGKKLGSTSWDSTIKVWNITDENAITLIGHSGYVNCMSWDYDGTKFASGSSDLTIKIWNTTYYNIKTLTGYLDVCSVSLNPNNTMLATGSYATIKVWNTTNWRNTYTLLGHTDFVRCVAWSPDSTKIASGSNDETIRIWSIPSGECIKTLNIYTGAVRSVAWGPDGTKLASAHDDATINIWDTSTWQITQTLNNNLTSMSNEWVSCLAWSHDGTKLAAGAGFLSGWGNNINRVRIWDTTAWKNITDLTVHFSDDSVNSVTWSPDDTKLASASDDSIIRVWNITTGDIFRNLTGHSESVECVAWSPNGKMLVSGSKDNIVKIWDTCTWENIKNLTGHNANVASICWSDDSCKFISSSTNGCIKVWNITTWENINTLFGFGAVESIAWSPDGTKLVSGSFEGRIKVWDTNEWQEILTLTQHSTELLSLAWSYDGTKLASGDYHGVVIVWNTSTWEIIKKYDYSGDVYGLAWSEDNSRLAVGVGSPYVGGENSVRILNATTLEEVYILSEFTDWVRDVSWNYDNTKLAVASDKVKIWDTVTWRNIQNLSGWADWAESVDWSPVNDELAVGAFDGTIRVYSMALLDSDSDGLPDYLELELGCNLTNPDTDGDGMLDGVDPLPTILITTPMLESSSNPLYMKFKVWNYGTKSSNIQLSSSLWVKFDKNQFTLTSGEYQEIQIFLDVTTQRNAQITVTDTTTSLSDSINIGLDARYSFTAADFDVSADGYNFTNYGLDIDSLSLTGFLKAFELVPYGTNVVDPIWLPLLYGLYLYAQNGGHCYGISSTSILYMENLLSLPYSADYAFELTKSQASSNINAYQSGRQIADILYDTISARYAHLSPTEQYNIIKNSLQSGKSIMVLMTSESGGHAVVAYKIIEDSNKAVIYIYDSNHNYSTSSNLFKSSFPYIVFNFTTNTFSYLDYTEFRAREPTVSLGNVTQSMINDLISLITSMLRNNNLMAVTLECPGDLLITDNQGRRTGIVNGVVVNEIPNAYIVSSGDTEVYFVLSNLEYSCKVTGTGSGDYTLKMITPEQDFTKIYSVNSTLTTNTIDDLRITSNGNVINITASEDKVYTLTITNKTNVTISTFFVSNVTINGTVMHSYSITDWSNLEVGNPVSLGVDKNRDGVIDATVVLSSGMTGEEINNLIKEQEIGTEAEKPSTEFLSLILLIVPIVAIVLIIAIVILVMRRRKIKTKGE